jgi:hypothetical protein
MDQVKVNLSKTVSINLGSDPDNNEVSVVVYHEFGDIVVGPSLAARSSSGVYNLQIGVNAGGEPFLNSAGKYRVDFTYSVSSVSYTKSQYFNVYTPYTDSDSFFELYPELEVANSSKFETLEARARAVINTYCGQTFESFIGKKLIVNGNNHTVLHLPFPISRLDRVVLNEDEPDEAVIFDSSVGIKNLEKVRQPFNFNSTFYIRFKKGATGITERILDTSTFKDSSSYSIIGDWGWLYVPEPVTQAANLLIADMMNDDGEYRKHGIVSVDMDNIRFSMKPSFYESTGNIEADVLLTDYTLFVMDYII